MKNTASLVKIYYRWMKENYPHETRPIEDTPAQELDQYLSGFFSTVRRKEGIDYLWKSFQTMKEALVRHLKLTNYPHSILTSPLFHGSQLAYKARSRTLKRAGQILHTFPHSDDMGLAVSENLECTTQEPQRWFTFQPHCFCPGITGYTCTPYTFLHSTDAQTCLVKASCMHSQLKTNGINTDCLHLHGKRPCVSIERLKPGFPAKLLNCI